MDCERLGNTRRPLTHPSPHPMFFASFWLKICRFSGMPLFPSCTCASLSAWKQMVADNLSGQRLHFAIWLRLRGAELSAEACLLLQRTICASTCRCCYNAMSSRMAIIICFHNALSCNFAIDIALI
jgi:hypothetical protein